MSNSGSSFITYWIKFSVISDYYTITILNSPIHIHGNNTTPWEWLLCVDIFMTKHWMEIIHKHIS